jgi:hypothetical protein
MRPGVWDAERGSLLIIGIEANFKRLSDNDLIVHGGNVSSIANLLANGDNDGVWDAASLWRDSEPAAIDSTSALNDPGSLESLGYVQVGTAQGDLNISTFDALAVSTGDVIVKFTYYGDANLDGTVDSTDQRMTDNGYHG